MEISKKLTEQEFKEILKSIYLKSLELENINIKEFIEEIKKELGKKYKE